MWLPEDVVVLWLLALLQHISNRRKRQSAQPQVDRLGQHDHPCLTDPKKYRNVLDEKKRKYFPMILTTSIEKLLRAIYFFY